MNNLCTDIGWKSINHEGEQLCGDHVDIVYQEDGSAVVVLADGLGSGVRASILSTLTSKIISTMLAEGLKLEDCVSAIAEALPVLKDKGVAYSTFTILHIIQNETVEIIQYENPPVIFFRGGSVYHYPTQELEIGGKKLLKSEIRLRERDCIITMSDGCPYASSGLSYRQSWGIKEIGDFMKGILVGDYTAKALAQILVDQCYKEYGGHPLDDATACIIKVRRREPLNVLFGPPKNRDDVSRMLSLFFGKEGRHVICGGTTASIAAAYLGKPVKPGPSVPDSDVPPTSEIEGVDLVTEGVLTLNRVVSYAKDALGSNELYEIWGYRRDGASLLSRELFERATDIHFYVGRASNPAHVTDEPETYKVKVNLVDLLSDCLVKMGKRIKVSYF
ncbi:MAG: SpoIIE family protein phosphatase [Oscillospiraceae bacterium]|nr:SpoIIE family protein phosphatase [Oscillospiraceae bacterium]